MLLQKCLVTCHLDMPTIYVVHVYVSASFPSIFLYRNVVRCLWCSWTLYGENLIKIDSFLINVVK